MAIRHLKLLGILLITFVFTGCPDSSDCDDIYNMATVPDLITITPLQQVYSQGDEVILKFSVPSANDYFAYYPDGVNFFEETNDNSGHLSLSSDQLFIDNELTFIMGSQGSYTNWFKVPYNPENGFYELEIRTKLNRTGEYLIYATAHFDVQGDQNCNRYRLDTNVLGMDSELGTIEFTVE